jgi:hypothetical protein
METNAPALPAVPTPAPTLTAEQKVRLAETFIPKLRLEQQFRELQAQYAAAKAASDNALVEVLKEHGLSHKEWAVNMESWQVFRPNSVTPQGPAAKFDQLPPAPAIPAIEPKTKRVKKTEDADEG